MYDQHKLMVAEILYLHVFVVRFLRSILLLFCRPLLHALFSIKHQTY